MKSIGQALKEMEVSIQTTIREPNDDEYMGEDGLIYCKKCNTRRQTKELILGSHQSVMCECQAEEYHKQEERKLQLEKQKIIDKLKKASLLGEKYKNTTFENTEMTSDEFKKIYSRCKKYCEVANIVLNKGIGIYLFGHKGTGKSHVTSCMANELMNNYYTVLYTNFSEISKQIRETFNNPIETEYNFLKRLTSIDFLFIDDFGTEIVTKNNQDVWLQEKIFEVVNKRYNNNKPIIFTSNYSLRQLIEERGLADKTVDRINEVCEVMKLEGNSYRKYLKEQREKIF